ncbi:inositol monophosphatase 3-like [Scleropages formosus]|uniref:inositol-phosphate phosphatase n=1 Tax=Scleropages formosus TaxID=113540 RepID=A0A0P7V0V3_SCLFO|nr:inositol monophosphatase 3-like [Scleropages formosus]
MAPMGVRLSPFGMAIFCVLGVAIIYYLYSEVLSGGLSSSSSSSSSSSYSSGHKSSRRTVDLKELLALSVEAAVRGGREVKRVREDNALEEKSKGETREGASEKLTVGDMRSHRQMFYLIKNTFPFIQVNSEEHDNVEQADTPEWDHSIPADISEVVPNSLEVPADSVTVWIDPLDATQEYTEDLRQYVTTMVCVAVGGEPVIGVIHKPFAGYTAWALVGRGANIKPREKYNGETPQVIVSRSHGGKVEEFIKTAFGNSTVIILAGGAGYKVLSLLNPGDDTYNNADVYIHVTYIKKWDICAGNAILRALGGHMTTLKGQLIDYSGSEGNDGGLLASIGVDHEALVKRLPEREIDRHR